MRKVYVNVVTRLIINIDEGVEIQEVLSDLDYNLSSTQADIVGSEIKEYNVEDSK